MFTEVKTCWLSNISTFNLKLITNVTKRKRSEIIIILIKKNKKKSYIFLQL